jgi:hypothetical protein
MEGKTKTVDIDFICAYEEWSLREVDKGLAGADRGKPVDHAWRQALESFASSNFGNKSGSRLRAALPW